MATDRAEKNTFAKNINDILKNKKLLFSDDFQTLDGKRWIIEMEPAEGSRVYAKNKTLLLDTRKGVTVWLNTLLTGNIAIEFDRTVMVDNGRNDRLSDMNVFWMASDPKKKTPFGLNGVFESYDSLNLYYAGIGGNTNSTSRFRKYRADGNKPIIKEYRDSSHLLTKNIPYHITIIVKDNDTSLWINDECYFDARFADPLKEGYFGFRSTWSRQAVNNFRVYQLL